MTRGRSVGIVVANQKLLLGAIQGWDFIELVANLPAQRILAESEGGALDGG